MEFGKPTADSGGNVETASFEKRDKLVGAEVGQHVTVPVEHGRLGLAGESFHAIEGVGIRGHIDLLIFVTGAIEHVGGLSTPRAAGFDEELRKFGRHFDGGTKF